MKRKEFSTKSEAIRKIDGWVNFVVIGMVLAMALGGPFTSYYLKRDGIGFQVFYMLSSVTILAWLFVMPWFPRYLARKRGLICPACRKSLIIFDHGFIVLRTGNCSKCGNEIFGDGTNVPGTPERIDWLTKEQFQVAIDKLCRNSNRRVVVFATVGFVLAIVSAPLGFHLSRLFDQGQLDSWLSPPVLRRALIVMLGTGVAMYLALFILGVTKKNKHRGVPCPECGRSILGFAAKAALEKNICIYCGTQLFAAPSAVKS